MSVPVRNRQHPTTAKPPTHTPLFPDAVRVTGVHITGAPGTGKSFLLAHGPMYDDFIRGIPQVVFDVTGVACDHFLDKISRIVPDFERRWREQYRQPLTPEWVRYLESVQDLFAERIVYVDMSGKTAVMPFPLIYRLSPEESLYEIASRLIEAFIKMDPDLKRAPVEGRNALERVGTNVLEILAALGRQITNAPELISHPEGWKDLFVQALVAYPEVEAPITAMNQFGTGPNKHEYRVRRSDSFVNKIDRFLKDPYQRAMYGALAPGLDWQQVIAKKQTVLLDFHKITSTEQLRFSLLWAFSYLLTFLRMRGSAGRENAFGVVIDEASVLLGFEQEHQSLMAEDIRLLLEVVGRAYGCWVTLAHQRLSQIKDPSIVEAFMQMGTQCVGRVSSPDEAEFLSRYLFRYTPDWVRKTERVWMSMQPNAYTQIAQALFGGPELPAPMVVDHHTTEYTIDEQRILNSYNFLDLRKLQFLTKIPLDEGDRAGELQLLDFNHFDTKRFLTSDQLAETRRRLAVRSGYSKEELLTQIEQESIKSLPKKSKENAKLKEGTPTHDKPRSLPTTKQPESIPPAAAAATRATESNGGADEDDRIWQ